MVVAHKKDFMRNIPKKITDKIKKNKESEINVPYCRKSTNCRDQLLATRAFNSMPNYRGKIKFDGGGV